MSRDFDTLFPDDRLTGDTPLRQGQLVMLRLLKILDKVSGELGLTYWLCGGTLIGAIRHEGFIPWDDDVDVFMPRDHYEEFIRKASDSLPYDVFLQTDSPWIRLVDRFGHRRFGGANKDFIFIDIFPAKRFPAGRRLLRRARMLVPPYPLPGIPAEVSPIRKVYRASIFALSVFLRITGLGFLIGLICRVGPVRYWSYDLEVTWRFYFRDDWIFPLRHHKFEDSAFYVPAEWHKVLTHQFDDYMTPPREDDRVKHGFETFLVTESFGHPESLEWNRYKERKAKGGVPV
ncbi:MAG: LicD family protein [Bacillota bacterium]|nr:LicD family protein [Bacillota bacterium]